MSDDPTDPAHGRPPIEPNADLRGLAVMLREWYIALTGAGFTESEGCRVIGVWLASQSGTGEQ